MTGSSDKFCKNPKFNLSYPEYDAFILYCLIRHFKPNTIIEIGSGMSTRVMIKAIQDETLDSKLICID